MIRESYRSLRDKVGATPFTLKDIESVLCPMLVRVTIFVLIFLFKLVLFCNVIDALLFVYLYNNLLFKPHNP
jgi:hypothetical protein